MSNSDQDRQTTFTAPRGRTLAKATLGATAVALILLFVAILPAEYGIDPTGAGKALGLTQMGAIDGATAQSDEPAQPPQSAPDETASSGPIAEGAMPPRLTQYAAIHEGPPKQETIEVHLKPGEEVEYKAQLPKGEPLFYSWSIPKGDIYFDFHGEPTEGDYAEGYFLSYSEGEGGGEEGSFTSPFTGNHGWYWLNYNEEPVTVTLKIQGYYTSHKEMYRAQNY